MRIKDWLSEVEKNNFPSKERQKELGWEYWKCSTNNLDSINRKIKLYLENLSDDIKLSWDIKIKNDLQTDPFGWTLTTVTLEKDGNIIDITNRDFSMMYQYNVYKNKEHIKETDELDKLIEFLQKIL